MRSRRAGAQSVQAHHSELPSRQGAPLGASSSQVLTARNPKENPNSEALLQKMASKLQAAKNPGAKQQQQAAKAAPATTASVGQL